MLDTITGWLIIGLLVAALYAAAEAVFSNRRRTLSRKLLSYAFTVYLVVLVGLSAVMGTDISPVAGGYNRDLSINLVPFRSIGQYFYVLIHAGMVKLFAANILGNIALLLPMGFFLPYFARKNPRWWKTLLICFGITTGIELIQLIFSLIGWFTDRVVDIDDILLNVFGGLAGYWIWLAAGYMAKRLRSRQAVTN